VTRPTIPRHAARLAAIAVLLAPCAARADDAPPPPAPPPAAGYAPYTVPMPAIQFAPYTPMRRRSRGRIVAGVVLLALGGTAVLAGTTLTICGANSVTYFDGYDGPSPTTVEPGLLAAGIVTLVLGAGAIAAGVPLLLSGLRRVPDTPAGAWLVPEVRAGAHGGALVWSF
jgi:hypothetical protein